MKSFVTCSYCKERQEFKSFCEKCKSRLVSPRSYDYKCTYCNMVWTATVEYDDRDDVNCSQCGNLSSRLLNTCYFSKITTPLNSKERGWDKDLKEANEIEKSLAYGSLAKAPIEDKARASKEIKKLKEV